MPHFLFLFLPRPPWGSVVTFLCLGSYSPPRMFWYSFWNNSFMDMSLCTIVLSQMVSYLDQFLREPGTNTLPISHYSFGRVLFLSPVPYINTQIVASCCYAVMWSAGQCKVNCLLPVSLGKHDASQSTFWSCTVQLAAWCWYGYLPYGQQTCRMVQGCVLLLWAPHWVPISVMGFLS